MPDYSKSYQDPARGKNAMEELLGKFGGKTQFDEIAAGSLRRVLENLNPGMIIDVKAYPDGRVRIMIATPDHGLQLPAGAPANETPPEAKPVQLSLF